MFQNPDCPDCLSLPSRDAWTVHCFRKVSALPVLPGQHHMPPLIKSFGRLFSWNRLWDLGKFGPVGQFRMFEFFWLRLHLVLFQFAFDNQTMLGTILGLYRKSSPEVWIFFKVQFCQFWTGRQPKSFWATLHLLGSLEFLVVLFLFPVCSGYPDDRY